MATYRLIYFMNKDIRNVVLTFGLVAVAAAGGAFAYGEQTQQLALQEYEQARIEEMSLADAQARLAAMLASTSVTISPEATTTPSSEATTTDPGAPVKVTTSSPAVVTSKPKQVVTPVVDTSAADAAAAEALLTQLKAEADALAADIAAQSSAKTSSQTTAKPKPSRRSSAS